MRDGEYQWFEAIVKMMNGHIDVDSELGKESKFKVTIFLKLRESEKETIEEMISLQLLWTGRCREGLSTNEKERTDIFTEKCICGMIEKMGKRRGLYE